MSNATIIIVGVIVTWMLMIRAFSWTIIILHSTIWDRRHGRRKLDAGSRMLSFRLYISGDDNDAVYLATQAEIRIANVRKQYPCFPYYRASVTPVSPSATKHPFSHEPIKEGSIGIVDLVISRDALPEINIRMEMI